MSVLHYAFLTVNEVLELHDLQLSNYGGMPGIRDYGLLESAVMMPKYRLVEFLCMLLFSKWQPLTHFTLQKISHLLMATNAHAVPTKTTKDQSL